METRRSTDFLVGQRLTYFPSRSDHHLHFPAVVEDAAAGKVAVRVFYDEHPHGIVRIVSTECLVDQLELDL